jgi:hypothetical protein
MTTTKECSWRGYLILNICRPAYSPALLIMAAILNLIHTEVFKIILNSCMVRRASVDSCDVTAAVLPGVFVYLPCVGGNDLVIFILEF